MTPAAFRRLALSLPEAAEGEHRDHPDFRVRGKIFATLMPDPAWGVVMLRPEDQRRSLRRNPAAFVPAKGAWGRRGCTQVLLPSVDAAALRRAITSAWLEKAPAELAERLRRKRRRR
jgi:hypothetical protein